MFNSGNAFVSDRPFTKNAVFPQEEFYGLNFQTTVVFAGTIQEFLNLTGPAPGTDLLYVDFRIQACYTVAAADFHSGQAIPLNIKLSSAFTPIPAGLETEYFSINYNGAVDAKINTGMRLVKPAFFSGNFGFTNQPMLEFQTNGFNLTTSIFVSYDYHFFLTPNKEFQ